MTMELTIPVTLSPLEIIAVFLSHDGYRIFKYAFVPSLLGLLDPLLDFFLNMLIMNNVYSMGLVVS